MPKTIGNSSNGRNEQRKEYLQSTLRAAVDLQQAWQSSVGRPLASELESLKGLWAQVSSKLESYPVRLSNNAAETEKMRTDRKSERSCLRQAGQDQL